MKTKKLTAYLGDPKIKKEYLNRVKAHQAADQIVQSHGYWRDGKGCAVGCTIHSSDHNDYETLLGIPLDIAYLEDDIFENLPVDLAKKWPAKFLSAIRVGADLSSVCSKLAVWLLIDTNYGFISHLESDEQKKFITQVANAYIRPRTSAKIWRKIEGVGKKLTAACYVGKEKAYSVLQYTTDLVENKVVVGDLVEEASYIYAIADSKSVSKSSLEEEEFSDKQKEYYSVMAKKLLELIKECKPK